MLLHPKQATASEPPPITPNRLSKTNITTNPTIVFFLLALTQPIIPVMYSIILLVYFLNSLPRNPNNAPNIPKHLPNQLSFGMSKVNIDKIPIVAIAISIKLFLHVYKMYSIIVLFII